jgi:hypothetical protein
MIVKNELLDIIQSETKITHRQLIEKDLNIQLSHK